MEIKTCEEYVLNELKKAQDETEKVINDYNDVCHLVDTLDGKIKYLTSVLDAVGKAIMIDDSTSSDMKIDFDRTKLYPWYEDNKPSYDLVYNYFKKDNTPVESTEQGETTVINE